MIFAALINTFSSPSLSGEDKATQPIAEGDTAWRYDIPVSLESRPGWTEKAIMIFDSPFTDDQLTQLAPWSKKLQKHGYTIMRSFYAEKGWCRLSEPSTGANWKDECHAVIKAYHAAGIKVIAGAAPITNDRDIGAGELLENHPEWIAHSDDPGFGQGGYGCLLSPYGDALIERVVSRIREFDLDGFGYDGLYQLDYCRADHCRDRYKAETGLDLPPKKDVADPAYLKYLVWRDKKILDYARKMHDQIHAAKPDAILMNWCNNDTQACYPSFMPESLNCMVDWVGKEWWDNSSVTGIYLIKRLRGGTWDRPAAVQPYMFTRGVGGPAGVGFGSSCPPEEHRYRMNKIMAMGSVPMPYGKGRQAWNEEDWNETAQDMIDFLPWVQGTKSYKFAAILDSFTTLQMSKSVGAGRLVPAFDAYRSGMARALLEAHIPFDIFSEHNATAEQFAQYKVIILPNVFCMSDRIVGLLREYVARGGALLATHETSLYDEWGNKRPDFALAQLFGVTYVATEPEMVAQRFDFVDNSHPVTADKRLASIIGKQGKGIAEYYGKFCRVKAAEDTSTPLRAVDVRNEKNDALKQWTPLALHEYQKGRVAYFGAEIASAYHEASYPYERILIENAIEWVTRETPHVRVVAPLSVFTSSFTKDDIRTRRLAVHLFNDLCSTVAHGSKNDAEQSIREEIIPIHDIRIIFPGERPSRVFAVPGNEKLKPCKTGTGWQVVLPRLDLHSVVVAEYLEDQK